MRGFFAGVVVTIIVIVAAVFFYFSSGMAPVATSAPMMPFERQLSHAALDAAISKDAPKSAPIQPTEANFTAGARSYLDNCAVCHGAPGKQPTAISRGEFPHPPKLMEGKGVTDDPVGETYWKTANGIRLTGMPGFKESLSDTQMWQISLLLANADKLPSSVTTILMGQETPITTNPPVPATNPNMPALAPPTQQTNSGQATQPK